MTTSRRSAYGGRRRPRPTRVSGAATAPPRWCSGSACRAGRRAGGTGRACARRTSASSVASSCSTCPTTTRPRSRTTSRSTGWWSWPTCWCGSSTRRSTPTAVLHERYLRRLATHDAVMVVVLNQIDTVNPFAAAECADDLRRLLDDDGLRRSPVVTASARSGAGIDGLRALLADAVAKRRARNDRLVADVEDVVEQLDAGGVRGGADGRSPRRSAAGWWRRSRTLPGSPSSERRSRSPGGCGPAGCSAGRRPGGPGGCAPTRCAGCTSRATTSARCAPRWCARRCPRRRRCSGPRSTPPCARACEAVSADLPAPWQQAVRRGRSWSLRRRGRPPRPGRRRHRPGRGPGAVVVARGFSACSGCSPRRHWSVRCGCSGSRSARYLRLPDPPTPDVGGLPVPTLLLVGGVAARAAARPGRPRPGVRAERWPGAGGPSRGCAGRSSRSPTSWCSARSRPSSEACPGPAGAGPGAHRLRGLRLPWVGTASAQPGAGLLSTALPGWLARPQIACRPCRCGSGCRIVGTGAAPGRDRDTRRR